MSEKEESNLDQENPEEIVDEIISSYDAIQNTFIKGASAAGKEKERFINIKSEWKDLAQSTTKDPDEANVYKSGVNALLAHRDEVKDLEGNMPLLTERFTGLLLSSELTASTTSGTAVIINPTLKGIRATITAPTTETSQTIQAKLTKLDPTLESTYLSISEILYGTQNEPERGALFHARQFFDHFFSVLSPDEFVRKSSFWRPHVDIDDPKKVTRYDRIIFAANTHVQHLGTRKTLIATGKHLLDVYRVLNKAHKRGELDKVRSREALKESFSFITRWVNAISLPLEFPKQTT